MKGANVGINKEAGDLQALVNAGAKLVRWQIWTSPQFTLDMAIDQIIADTIVPQKVIALFSVPSDLRLLPEVWEHIATRLKNVSGIYGYDLVNEPNLKRSKLVSILAETAARIKFVDPLIRIIASPKLGFASELRKMKPIPNISTYTVHLWAPLKYSHQGVLAQFPKVRDFTRSDLKVVLKDISRARAWSKKYDRRILIGEFGVARWAPRAGVWLASIMENLSDDWCDWCFHAWRDWHGWDQEMSTARNDGVGETRSNTTRMDLIKFGWNK